MSLQFQIPTFDPLRVEGEDTDRKDHLKQFRAKIGYLNLADQFLKAQDSQSLKYSGSTGATDSSELYTIYADRLQLIRLQKKVLEYEGFDYVLSQLKQHEGQYLEVISYQFEDSDFHLFVSDSSKQVVAILKRNREDESQRKPAI